MYFPQDLVTIVSYCGLLLAPSLVKVFYFVTGFPSIWFDPFHPFFSKIHGEELRDFICLLMTEEKGRETLALSSGSAYSSKKHKLKFPHYKYLNY